jgi:hypothetical protein
MRNGGGRFRRVFSRHAVFLGNLPNFQSLKAIGAVWQAGLAGRRKTEAAYRV